MLSKLIYFLYIVSCLCLQDIYNVHTWQIASDVEKWCPLYYKMRQRVENQGSMGIMNEISSIYAIDISVFHSWSVYQTSSII